MTQPLKQHNRSANVAWCVTESAPNLLALGTSSCSAGADILGGGTSGEATLDLVSFDLSSPGSNFDVVGSVKTEGGRRFNSISWGALGVEAGSMPYGLLAGGHQDGSVAFWNPQRIVSSSGADSGLLHLQEAVHNGPVNCLSFHPAKPNLMATGGVDGVVNIVEVSNPSAPQTYPPSDNATSHAGSEILNCAWNRKVPHILASCSNKGKTVVWDLKLKKEVISFQDPSSRLRCSDVSFNPEKPLQLLAAYDDDRQPSLQMWDLRNTKYPFKEAQGHSKGILGVCWNDMDPNLILSCGKDNKILCWFNGSQTLETFCEIPSPHTNFEVHWAPHRPSLLAAGSLDAVSLHSMQMQQTATAKYCPSWYRRPCGVSFGFGGKMLSFGRKVVEDLEPPATWCHSVVVPNEPEIVPTADKFEQWRCERRLQEFCLEKKAQCGGNSSHEGLMWDLMGLQFDDAGRVKLPSLLGFDQDRIEREAEHYLGKVPGSTLMGPRQDMIPTMSRRSTVSMGPDIRSQEAADDFFRNLAETNEKRTVDAIAEEAKAVAEATPNAVSDGTDWSTGPESLVKQSLLVGNLTAAVECCFKSGRMAEALLLASGGGTELWKRARDEFLRLQGDSFLSTVGKIMTNDFETLVECSDLRDWMETLAIIATYSNAEGFPVLCELLAGRLQNEACDIKSAVICYICAKNFSKTVGIWANMHGAVGSNRLALQDLVEKMTVLQEATKFNQADVLFNGKLTQYAEILANSGRLTAAMGFLCLLHDDASSAILRDRIYNSAPMQMNQLFGRPPAAPWQAMDVRILVHHQPGADLGSHGQPNPNFRHGAGPARGGVPVPGPNRMPGAPVPPTMQPQMPPRPPYMAPGPGPAMGSQPAFPGIRGNNQPPGPSLSPSSIPPGPSMGPAPRIGGPMPPQPKVGGRPCGAPPHPGMAPPGPEGMGYGPPAHAGMMPARPGPGLPPNPMGSMNNMPPCQPHSPVAPPPQGMVNTMSGGCRHGHPTSPSHAHQHQQQQGSQVAGGLSTAPGAAARPVVEDQPESWPIPTNTQQRLRQTQTTAATNQVAQGAGAGSGGDPMPESELNQVKAIFNMLLSASTQQDPNPKKRDDIAKRLEELYSRLANGQIKKAASDKVLHLVRCLEAQDYAGATQTQTQLCTINWDQNKNWLMGVKRLIPRC